MSHHDMTLISSPHCYVYRYCWNSCRILFNQPIHRGRHGFGRVRWPTHYRKRSSGCFRSGSFAAAIL